MRRARELRRARSTRVAWLACLVSACGGASHPDHTLLSDESTTSSEAASPTSAMASTRRGCVPLSLMGPDDAVGEAADMLVMNCTDGDVEVVTFDNGFANNGVEVEEDGAWRALGIGHLFDLDERVVLPPGASCMVIAAIGSTHPGQHRVTMQVWRIDHDGTRHGLDLVSEPFDWPASP